MGRKTASARVTERGQVTIPGEIRRQLGIIPGTNLKFRAEDGKLIAVKDAAADPVSRVYGIAGKGSTERIMKRLRGEKIITAIDTNVLIDL